MGAKEKYVQLIEDRGVVAIVRTKSSEQLLEVAEAVKRGGLDVLEFTMTTPNALQTISQVADKFGDQILLGAGTVLDPETARAAILAGARFIVSPTMSTSVIEMCQRYNIITMPGCFTPTEMLTAWEAGADFVKVFPATAVGPKFLKDVLAPLPQLKLIPTGGVSLENTGDFIKAGAVAVAVGGNLVSKKVIEERAFDQLAEVARQYIAAVRQAREKSS
jgi:2-dehydro-3-deoxyphosphogluconate aldolase / (4S)-4-hydroxy-2-oxoglutarate aldolase